MPFYDFTCLDCGHRFETMRSIARRDDAVTCPSCGGKEARRELPRINALMGGTGSAPAGCEAAASGGCGSGFS